MTQIQYRLYPTLLNEFDRYQQGLVEEQTLLDRVNRIQFPTTVAQQRGVSFEEAVVKGVNEDEFDYRILEKARALLPRPMVKTQVYCEYVLGNVLLYGYVDVIGKILAADIKTTRKYVPDSFATNHQNFYLLALRSRGIRSLRYVITDFEDVYHEDFENPLDFSVQEKQIALFCCFLEENRMKIADKKIFGN